MKVESDEEMEMNADTILGPVDERELMEVEGGVVVIEPASGPIKSAVPSLVDVFKELLKVINGGGRGQL